MEHSHYITVNMPCQ